MSASADRDAARPSGWGPTSGPGITALGLAAARAVETSRADRLINDPFARALFEAADAELPMRIAWPDSAEPVSDAEALHLHGSRYIGLRTRFYDDELVTAVDQADVQQVVILGCGLDTRAFRLAVPTTVTLFELDQPGVLAYKKAVLTELNAQPSCHHVTVGADLREEWVTALLDAGFDRSSPSLWIAEGLLPYLTPDQQIGMLERITELSAQDSRLAFDRIVGDPTADGRLDTLTKRSGIDMRRLLAAGDLAATRPFLERHGWRVTERPTSKLAGRYGRDLTDPFSPSARTAKPSEPPWLDTVFTTARLIDSPRPVELRAAGDKPTGPESSGVPNL